MLVCAQIIDLPQEDVRGRAQGLGGRRAERDAQHPAHLHDDPLHDARVEEHRDHEREEEDDGEGLEVEHGCREELALDDYVHGQITVDKLAAHVGVPEKGLDLVAEACDHRVTGLKQEILPQRILSVFLASIVVMVIYLNSYIYKDECRRLKKRCEWNALKVYIEQG